MSGGKKFLTKNQSHAIKIIAREELAHLGRGWRSFPWHLYFGRFSRVWEN